MNHYNGFTPQQRMAGLDWLKREYRAGRRQPPKICDVCGQTEGIIEAHSENYSEPHGDHIGQFGLCYRCHMIIHCRFRNPAAWNRYREAIREGWTFEAMHTRNFPKFAHQLNGLEPPHTTRPAPTRLVLDEIEAGAHLPKGTKPSQSKGGGVLAMFGDK